MAVYNQASEQHINLRRQSDKHPQATLVHQQQYQQASVLQQADSSQDSEQHRQHRLALAEAGLEAHLQRQHK